MALATAFTVRMGQTSQGSRNTLRSGPRCSMQECRYKKLIFLLQINADGSEFKDAEGCNRRIWKLTFAERSQVFGISVFSLIPASAPLPGILFVASSTSMLLFTVCKFFYWLHSSMWSGVWLYRAMKPYLLVKFNVYALASKQWALETTLWSKCFF